VPVDALLTSAISISPSQPVADEPTAPRRPLAAFPAVAGVMPSPVASPGFRATFPSGAIPPAAQATTGVAPVARASWSSFDSALVARWAAGGSGRRRSKA
jgi:hypothetical protein